MKTDLYEKKFKKILNQKIGMSY